MASTAPGRPAAECPASRPRFVIGNPVTIQGAGRATTIISGGGATTGTVVDDETSAPVTIKGVTIAGGTWAPNSGPNGGRVVVGSGTVTMTRGSVHGNDAASGGGFDIDAGGQGGGIIQNGSATLTNSSVMRNTTSASARNGSGIYVISGNTVTCNSTKVLYNLPHNLVNRG